MSTPTLTSRARAVLKINRFKILRLLAVARAIDNALRADTARFASPVPTLVVLRAQITALDTAQQAVATRARDAVPARNTARDTLWTSLQTLADAAGEGAVALIKAAGMNVALPHALHKPLLQVKLTTTPGLVQVIAHATMLRAGTRKPVTYLWYYSIDSGHTWVLGNYSSVAHSTIRGLPPMTTCLFRVAIAHDGVTGDPSPAVSLPIH